MYVQTSSAMQPLGAFSKGRFTLEYYANPSDLRFKDRNLKGLYEGMRDADFAFQKALSDVAGVLAPLWDTLENLSGGKLKKREIMGAFRLRLPVALPALVLEVAAGGRPLDSGFRGFARMTAQESDQNVALFGTLSGVNTTLAALSLIPALTPFLAPLLPVTANLAWVAGIATGLAATVGAVAKMFAREELPSKQQFKSMLETSATLAGKPKPSRKQVDEAYASMKTANESGKDVSANLAKLEADSKRKPAPKKQEKVSTSSSGSRAMRPASSGPGPGPGGIPPVALGVGVLALAVGGYVLLRD